MMKFTPGAWRAFAVALVMSLAATITVSPAHAESSGFTGAVPLPAKRIGILSSTLGAEVVVHWETTAKKGVQALGWTADSVDGKSDPQVWGQAINAFTQRHMDAIIVIGGLQLSTIATQLRAAKAAKIPIVHVGIRATDPQHLFDGDFAPDDARFGAVLADYLNKKLPPRSEFVTLQLSSCELCNAPVPVAISMLEKAGHKAGGMADMSLNGDLAGQAKKMSVDLLRAHPKAKAMIACCDFVATFSAPALAQAGFGDVLNAVRYDDLSVLQLIRQGKPVITVANNNDDFILSAVDALAAYFASGTPIPAEAPATLAKYEVVDSANLPPKGEYFFSPDKSLEAFSAKWKATYKR
ncbi:sugar ABC transporter substrate-binding protein [Paraburkholderia strydomiana]|uniref:sugar ABC transporter substrate-binding protein n=1 Tax=Paraburkholderia strydomiana TaxID=1245417 RepID=UPI0038BA8EF0